MAQSFLTKPSGVVSECDYLSISGSNAGGGATWYAGEHSVDGGNNTGWIFANYLPPAGFERAGEPVEAGVYTLAHHTAEYPMVLDLTYPISERSGSDFVFEGVEIGSILVAANDVFVSWYNHNTGGYGVDKLDYDNKLNGAFLESRIASGNREQFANFTKFGIFYAEIPVGTAISVAYSKDYGTTYVTPTNQIKDTDRKTVYVEPGAEATVIQMKATLTAVANTAPSIESGAIFLS